MLKFEGYIIYNPATNLYSRGGAYESGLWGKRPKFWIGMGPLKSHISMIIVSTNYSLKEIKVYGYYRNCQVIDAKTQSPVPNFDIYGYVSTYIERRCTYELKNNFKIVELP